MGLVAVFAASAQTRTGTISGRVVDESGHPVAGATVVIVGTQRGAATDNNGQFAITGVTDDEVTVSVSFVGKSTVTQRVSLEGGVIITLRESAVEVEQVIVTGLFNRPVESFTGAAKTISGAELQRVGSGNVFQSLRNIDPSLNLNDNLEFGSDPNKLPDIQLRGQSSFPLSEEDISLEYMYQGSPNMPLFILDGFEVSATRIFDLDMARIENITILKDASAKALYGANAANGVIVVQTKRSQGVELIVSYRGSVDIEMPDLTSYNLTNSLEKLQVEMNGGIYEQNVNLPSYLSNMQLYNDRLNRALAGTNIDWLSKPLRTGVGTKHSVSLDMQQGNLSALVDGSYNSIQGVMKGSKRSVIQGAMNVSYRRDDKFLVSNIMNIVSNKEANSPYGEFADYAKMDPYNDPYDQYGNLVEGWSQTGGRGMEMNPLWNTQFKTALTKDYVMFSDQLFAEYYPIQNLTLRLRGSIETQRNNKNEFYPADHTIFSAQTDVTRRGSYTHAVGRRDMLSADFSTMYNHIWGKHVISGNFNYELKQTQTHEVGYKAEGFPSPEMNDMLFAQRYEYQGKPSGREDIVREMSFTGLAIYVYDTRFLAEFTARGSASSRYSPKKRWGAFWGIGLGWNIHNERWAKDLGWMKELKLRGSVGTTGAQNVDAYSHMVTYNYYSDKFYYMGGNNPGSTGAGILRLANTDLKWQRKFDANVGIDASLWNRLTLTLDAYISTTRDLVIDFTLPTSTGYTFTKENVGDVENKGLELNFTYRLVNRNDFFLNITGAATLEVNTIRKLSDAMKEYNARMDKKFEQEYNEDGTEKPLRIAPVMKYVEGGSMNTIWAMKSLGIDPTTGQEIFVNRNGEPTFVYSAAEQIAAGNKGDKYRGNFGFNGEYKGFGLSVVLRFKLGAELYNETLINKVENVDIYSNVDRRVFEGRWTPDNPNAPYKAFRVYNPVTESWQTVPRTQASTRFVQKRNELDIAAVSAYYDLNRIRVIRNMGMSRLRLHFNMNEIHKFSSIRIERGTKYPFARTMSFSLTAEF